MTRLLDGLTDDQQLAVNYLRSTWEDRSKYSAKDVFKERLKLKKDLGKSVSVPGAATSSGKQQVNKPNEDKFHKHPNLYHKWSKCDLNPNTTDVAGRDSRRMEKTARGSSC